ncbi:glycosyltransferase family 4 protein [Alteromonas sp. S167]|uniref:glycosyltransferase family 4 protein n=1 Tax=Alteromonas sp. S167 TaxID=3117402 RepID=UPI002FE42760
MNTLYFKPMAEKAQANAVNVLTLTEVFPSLIQPWLINHLVQIHKHGGDNRILCLQSELNNFSEAIAENDLLERYIKVPTSKIELFKFFIKHRERGVKGSSFKRLSDVWQREETSIKHKAVDLLVSPAINLDVDIVHSHIESVSARCYRLIKAKDSPFVMTFHGLTPVGVPHIRDIERKRITQLASIIFANTNFAKKQYVALGAPEEKFELIPQGIDLSKWHFSDKEFNSEHVLNVITVGRFHPDKGHKYALRAIKNLKNKGVKLHYTIAGNGPYKQDIINEIMTLRLENEVTVLERLSDAELRQLYSKTHIFILPSLKAKDGFHEETQAVVIQEAQASGVIVIATNAGGIPECVDDGKSAFLVNDRSADEITEQMLALLSESEDWGRVRRRAREWVEENFCSNVIGKRINDAYMRALN